MKARWRPGGAGRANDCRIAANIVGARGGASCARSGPFTRGVRPGTETARGFAVPHDVSVRGGASGSDGDGSRQVAPVPLHGTCVDVAGSDTANIRRVLRRMVSALDEPFSNALQVSPYVQVVAVATGDYREDLSGTLSALVAADEQTALTAHRESPTKAVQPMTGARQRKARPFPWRWA